MGILDRLSPSAQFIEVIEWLDDSSDTMLYRFPVRGQEIKNGAQLIVRESQAAVFVHEGQIADVFGPGRYTVEGGNTPILSKLGAWKFGFNSPFKSEVYFINTKQFTDLKWGTSNPVMMRDADFGMVRLRAFGIYSMRVADPRELIKQIAGTNARFVTEDIEGQLRRTMVSGFSDALAESKIAALDLASNYDELSKFSRDKLQDEFKLVPLSSYGKPYTPPAGAVDPALDMKTAVREQVNRMDAAAYFTLLCKLMKDNPPAAADAPQLAKFARIGIVPGQDFDASKLKADFVRRVPEIGFDRIMLQFKVNKDMKDENGWGFTTKTGIYGTDYLMRALVTAIGLGANRPQDAVYPTSQRMPTAESTAAPTNT